MSASVPGALCAVLALISPPQLILVALFVSAGTAVTCTGFRATNHFAGTIAVVCLSLLAASGVRYSQTLHAQAAPSIKPAHTVAVSGRVTDLRRSNLEEWEGRLETTSISSEYLTVSSRISVSVRFPGTPPVPGSTVVLSVRGLERGRRSWLARVIELHVAHTPAPGALRFRLQSRILRRIQDVAGERAGLIAALVLGSRADLDSRTEELFRRAGVSHVLALSGMHLALLTGSVVVLLRRIIGSRFAMCIGGGVALVFTLLIGPKPSLVRATVMCELAICLRLTGRDFRLVELLCLSFLVHLVLQPNAAGQLSFQLSYLALFGIATTTPPLLRQIRGWFPARALSPLAAGIGAQLASAPLLIATFGVVYPAGIVAGLLVAPFIALLMAFGLFAGVVDLTAVPRCAWLLGSAVDAISLVLDRVVWWFAGLPGLKCTNAAWPVGAVSGILSILSIASEGRRQQWSSQNLTIPRMRSGSS